MSIYSRQNVRRRNNIHSRKVAAKLIQIFPSHVPRPDFLTLFGMLAVSSSSKRRRIPPWSRNPTTILGTPRRKDCAQNFRSFRSNLTMSRSFLISAEVLSSTQLIGSSLRSGLLSQTAGLRSETSLFSHLRDGEITYWHRLLPRGRVSSVRYQCAQLSSIAHYYSQQGSPGLQSLPWLLHPMSCREQIWFRTCSL